MGGVKALRLILFLGQFRGLIRWSTVKVRPVDVQSQGDVKCNDRCNRRVNITANRRELEIPVEQDVLGGEERGHRQQDNQDAIEENYPEVAVLVALLLPGGRQNKNYQRNTRFYANNPKKKKPTEEGGQVVPTGEGGESCYSHSC